MRSVIVLLALLFACCAPDDPDVSGDDDAEGCCWLWPATGHVVQCVRARIDPGCVEVECAFGLWATEVCRDDA